MKSGHHWSILLKQQCLKILFIASLLLGFFIRLFDVVQTKWTCKLLWVICVYLIKVPHAPHQTPCPIPTSVRGGVNLGVEEQNRTEPNPNQIVTITGTTKPNRHNHSVLKYLKKGRSMTKSKEAIICFTLLYHFSSLLWRLYDIGVWSKNNLIWNSKILNKMQYPRVQDNMI